MPWGCLGRGCAQRGAGLPSSQRAKGIPGRAPQAGCWPGSAGSLSGVLARSCLDMHLHCIALEVLLHLYNLNASVPSHEKAFSEHQTVHLACFFQARTHSWQLQNSVHKLCRTLSAFYQKSLTEVTETMNKAHMHGLQGRPLT